MNAKENQQSETWISYVTLEKNTFWMWGGGVGGNYVFL